MLTTLRYFIIITALLSRKIFCIVLQVNNIHNYNAQNFYALNLGTIGTTATINLNSKYE